MLSQPIQKGFTLVELMITISIMAIILAIAVPNFIHLLKKIEANNVSNHLQTFLTTGKQNALIYQKTITLCVANEQYQCINRNGTRLLVFTDNNNNQKYDSTTDFLYDDQSVSLRFGTLVTSVALHRTYIELKPSSGRPIGYMGHIKYCPKDNDSQFMFKVSFSKTGIVKHKSNQQEATNC